MALRRVLMPNPSLEHSFIHSFILFHSVTALPWSRSWRIPNLSQEHRSGSGNTPTMLVHCRACTQFILINPPTIICLRGWRKPEYPEEKRRDPCETLGSGSNCSPQAVRAASLLTLNSYFIYVQCIG